jgi:TolA-binding protein
VHGALAALLLSSGCAGGAAVEKDRDDMRAELRALRRENEELARRVDGLSGQVDVLTARATRPAEPRPDAPMVVPSDLEVVKIAPPAARSARAAPPVPTAVAISEPDPERLEALARPSRRELAADADAELRAARRREGLDRAHALEDFAARYPRHASADNALLEASETYAGLGRADACCALARRTADDYPAGDAMSAALERLAWCESRRGAVEAERRFLRRLVAEYPSTPAAERAGARLASISGNAGEPSPGTTPARSGP